MKSTAAIACLLTSSYGLELEGEIMQSDTTIVDHQEFFYKQKQCNEERCTGGCPDKMDGYGSGTCHESHPINCELKFDSPDYGLRCQYPHEPVEEDTGDELYEFNQKHLDKHNEYRRLHQSTPDLEYDAELAAAALEWSMYLSTIGFLQHSQEPGYGENLAWSSNSAQAESTSTCYTWNNISWSGESCGDSPAWTTCGCKTCTECGSSETICYDFSYGAGIERPCEPSADVSSDTWATEAWYEEIEDYNFNSPGYQAGTGHFTQAIWVNSEKIGCAEYDNYVTCRYFPQGNISNAGYFEANVKPLKE